MAKVAQIYIDGEILPESYIWPEYEATSLYRVRKQIEAAGDFDTISLNIFSPGGYCLEGWAIVDYLLSLGKKITTLAYGQCASFGTVLHAMGETREISQHCEYVIHRPWDFTMGNDLQIEAFLPGLKKETTKLFEFYAPPTGKTVDELAALIRDKDLKLSPEETVQHGFSTSIYKPGPAASTQLTTRPLRKPTYLMSLKDRKPNPNAPKDLQSTHQNTMAEKKKSIAAALQSALAFFNGVDAKALDITLKDGRKIVTNSTGEEPVKGDTVTLDGEPAPDGDYEMADGTILTVAGGEITNVDDSAVTDSGSADAADAVDATVVATPAAMATLTKQYSDLQAKYDKLSARQEEGERRMRAVLGGMVSQDVNTQANRIPANGKTEGQSDRDAMLAEHVAMYAPKKPVAQS